MEEDKSVKEKGFLGKVKDLAEDKEHQIEFLGTVDCCQYTDYK